MGKELEVFFEFSVIKPQCLHVAQGPHIRCAVDFLDIPDFSENLSRTQHGDTLGFAITAPDDLDLTGQNEVHAPSEGPLFHQQLPFTKFA